MFHTTLIVTLIHLIAVLLAAEAEEKHSKKTYKKYKIMPDILQHHKNKEFEPSELRRRVSKASINDQVTLKESFEKVASAIRAKHL